jgi:hypothetical protein
MFTITIQISLHAFTGVTMIDRINSKMSEEQVMIVMNRTSATVITGIDRSGVVNLNFPYAPAVFG